MADFTITIHVGNNEIKSITQRWQELHRSTNDTVKWSITPSEQYPKFTVTFKNGTPFQNWVFDQDNNESGPIQAPPPPTGADQIFQYLVEVPGCDPVDPGIIIWK